MKQRQKDQTMKILIYILIILGALSMLLSFFWMISTSLKTPGEAVAMSPVWLPKVLQIENFKNALSMAPFGKYFINSLLVTTISAIGELLTTILAAYAFARLEFYGKNVLFVPLISTMMVPGELLTIPNFVTLSN